MRKKKRQRRQEPRQEPRQERGKANKEGGASDAPPELDWVAAERNQPSPTAPPVDAFADPPPSPKIDSKAEALRRVRAAGEKAVAEGKKPYQRPDIGKYDSGRPKTSVEEYAEKAAEARAQGFTGVTGGGGLAELYQMQVDKARGVAPGTYTALSKGAKRIAPDYRIRQRLASKVAKGQMTPKGAGMEFQRIQDQKLAYDDPRSFDEARKNRAAAIQEAIRTGSPLPDREVEEIGPQLSEYDKRRLERQRNYRGPRFGGTRGVYI